MGGVGGVGVTDIAQSPQSPLPELQRVRSCVKVEVAILGFGSITVFMVSVDVKRH